jgi:hypothetical protein
MKVVYLRWVSLRDCWCFALCLHECIYLLADCEHTNLPVGSAAHRQQIICNIQALDETRMHTHGLGLGLEVLGELDLVVLNEGGASVEAAGLKETKAL